jgi:DNA helicase II / ATP-dependent DNA helicase PcrA
MSGAAESDNSTIDKHVDDEIAACLDLANPRSFFLFAGAGSGKTRSLVEALKHIRKQHGTRLRLHGRRVAVITYTNAAADEITRRIEFDPVVMVRTIHSFAWTLIEGFTKDIREWLRVKLADDISELEAAEAKGRKGTKASATRLASIALKQRRFQNLVAIKKFIYSPTGDNRGQDALNHAEVIDLVSHFIQQKVAMQHLLVGRFPILLIDESQDTNKRLIDALFALQAAQPADFCLGLLGDMMQRIYSDGKEGLGTDLPADWAKPVKRLNHRCPKRVVRLINKIRAASDGQVQEARHDLIEGHCRMFVLPSDTPNKPTAERAIAEHMAALTGEPEWTAERGCKRLTLEHRMAAGRMGFADMFVPLQEVDDFRTGLLDGTLSITRFYSALVLPLIKRRADAFAVIKMLRRESPLLAVEALRKSDDPAKILKDAAAAVASLVTLWDDGQIPTYSDVLRNVAASGLFLIPDALRPFAFRDEPTEDEDDTADNDRLAARLEGIERFLRSRFDQTEPYTSYVSGTADFDTHQGVKGLEFPRVMVVMDDAEARGFLFKYEKLFGGGAGEDTSTASTRRLFYVTCSRTERGLALVAYSTDPARVRGFVVGQGWFEADEVHVGIP